MDPLADPPACRGSRRPAVAVGGRAASTGEGWTTGRLGGGLGLAPGFGVVYLVTSLASSTTCISAAFRLSWIRCATQSWPNVQLLLDSQ